MQDLPEMTVEARDSKTAHGIKPPIKHGTPEYKEQLQDMIILCIAAKEPGYSEECIRVLEKYCPIENPNIAQTMQQIQFFEWKQCVEFVRADKCVELGLILHKFVTEFYKAEPKKDKDFIDGEGGVGFYRRLMDRMDDKLEKAFDAKYFFKQERPLIHLIELVGEDAADSIINYMHPGHYSFPAGHSTKFATIYDYIHDSYELTESQDKFIHVVAYVLSMARSGGGVHLPQDNCAGFTLVNDKIFDDYKES